MTLGRCPLSIFCARGTPPRVDSTAGGRRTVPPLRRNVKRFRGGLVVKAHRLLYRSTLGLRVIKKKRKGHAPCHGSEPERAWMAVQCVCVCVYMCVCVCLYMCVCVCVCVCVCTVPRGRARESVEGGAAQPPHVALVRRVCTEFCLIDCLICTEFCLIDCLIYTLTALYIP